MGVNVAVKLVYILGLKKLLKGGIRTKFCVGLCIFSALDLHVKYSEKLCKW